MKGDFMWAVAQMKEGKKVRRPHWSKELYWKEKYKCIDCGIEGRSPILDFTNYLATDWEIYEEKKTLSDRIVKYDGQEHIHINFIQLSLKEFIDWIHSVAEDTEPYMIKAEAIFGSRLMEEK